MRFKDGKNDQEQSKRDFSERVKHQRRLQRDTISIGYTCHTTGYILGRGHNSFFKSVLVSHIPPPGKDINTCPTLAQQILT